MDLDPSPSTTSRLRTELVTTFGPLLADVHRVVLVGFPTHANAGDSLIWLGQVALLAELGIEVAGVVPKESFDDGVFRRLPADVAVVLAGGGSFGDLWLGSQLARERTIRAAAGRLVVQLPQSLCYRDEANIVATREVLAAHGDVVLTWRDDESYKTALELFPDSTSVMVPDVAFAAGPLRRTHPAADPIISIARTDQEGGELAAVRVGDTTPRDWDTRGTLAGAGRAGVRLLLGFEHRIDPLRRHAMWLRVCNRTATALVDAATDMVSTGRVVVSDRLHAHVFCTMLGIPHVMVDTRYGKISAFIRTWTADDELVTLAASPRDAVESALTIARTPAA